jgi:hypothetical protein
MRNNSYLIALFLFVEVLAGCHREKESAINIGPFSIKMHGSADELSTQLRNRKTTLAYDNSYQWDSEGLRSYYFNDGDDSLLYYFEIFTLNDEIQEIDGAVYSKKMSNERLKTIVEREILQGFRKSAARLDTNANVIRIIAPDEKDKSYQMEVHSKAIMERKRELEKRSAG